MKLRKNILRFLKYIALAAAILCLLVYAGFFIYLEISESRWLAKNEFHVSMDISSKRQHQLTLLDNGIDSLARRLQLIEGAKESIDLEFFIYSLDESSRLVNQALVAKARQGVKVRVLVDFSVAVFQFGPGYAKKLKDTGIEVKYYNTASVTRILSVQHRTHRKMLIVDNEVAVIGGRNIANDYFDLSTHYNFLDSDLMIRGWIVGPIRDSFQVYWSSSWAKDPDYSEAKESEDDPALAFLNETSIDQDMRDQVLVASQRAHETPPSICRDIRFVTDYPGAQVSSRKLFPAIIETLGAAKKDVLVETPYFILRRDGANAIKTVSTRGVKFTFLTNSLHSTDAYYTVAALVPGLFGALSIPNLNLWAYKGEPLKGYSEDPPESHRWGVHAKRGVVDDDTILLGTYNIDPRSANFNSEMMVVCKGNKELAAQMRESINRRIEQSRQVIADGKTKDFAAIIGDADAKNIAMMLLSMPLSSLFSFLL